MKPEARQSLTVLSVVADAEACATELAAARLAVEAAFREISGLHTACLAVLPPEGGVPVLLFECSFEGPLRDLLGVLFARCAPEMRRIFRHCADFPEPADGPAFAALMSARACRAVACADSESMLPEPDIAQRLRTALASRCYWQRERPRVDARELERRRAAVGLQDWQPGVPLLHVARVAQGSRARLRAALRAIELEPGPIDYAARFLRHGEQLVFLAYPSENALLWSELVSSRALQQIGRAHV